MITLTTVSYIHEADLLCMKLEAGGVESFIPDMNTAQVNPFYSGAMGGIRVQIHEQDLDKAREILADEGAKIEGLYCPQCGSSNIEYQRFSKRFAVLSLLLLGIPLLSAQQGYVCRECRHEWKRKDA
jgi:hypothetical protein